MDQTVVTKKAHQLILKSYLNLEFLYLDYAMALSLMQHILGGKVEKAPVREYGKTEVHGRYRLQNYLQVLQEDTVCWMSHFDYISQAAPGFKITGHTQQIAL